MALSNYRDPATLEEAMREIRHLRKVDKKFDELRAENAALLAANRGSMDHYNELRAELDALKSQPPVAVFNMAINESVGAIYYDFAKHKLPTGTKFYLAPGAQPHYEEQPDGSVIPVDPSEMCAQPVPEGMVLVPEEISEAMYEAYHKVDDAAWAAGSLNGANMSEIWDAMLEAAKP